MYKIGEERPYIRIELVNVKPDIFSSKAGGLGYIPHDKSFPVDKEGQQLRLLAQINCSDFQLEGFMESGLLQFWILNDDVSGLDFDILTNQDGFRVIYYPESEIDRTVTREEIESKFVKNQWDDEEYYMPVFGEYGMKFGNSINTYYDPDDEEQSDEYYDECCGNKIGGFPYFTQSDPRYDEETEKYDYLLFQLDSCGVENEDGTFEDAVMWGDSGIGNFFIKPESLKNLDFSDVLYNWDCC